MRKLGYSTQSEGRSEFLIREKLVDPRREARIIILREYYTKIGKALKRRGLQMESNHVPRWITDQIKEPDFSEANINKTIRKVLNNG